MFFSEKPAIKLTKLYFSILLDGNIENIRSMVNEILSVGVETPFKFSLNYGRDFDISELNSGINQIEYENLEYLEILGRSGRQIVVISQPFKKFKLDCLIFECFFISACENKFANEIILMEKICKFIELHYAYARNLRIDYLPSNEKKIKRNVWGGNTVTVNRVEDEWFVDPKEILNGAFKKIYIFNYWTKKTLNKISNLGVVIPFKNTNNSPIYFFDGKDRNDLIEKNKKFKNLFVFDNV